METPDADPLETLEIFPTVTQAEWARTILESHGISAVLLDVRTAGLYNANLVGGIRLQVRRDCLRGARSLLADHPYSETCLSERTAAEEETTRCPACGADDQAAVAPGDSRTGGYSLRCLRCSEQFPVSADTYRSDDFPLLPSTCPECGSALLHNVEAPTGMENDALDRQWVRCDECAHEWEAPLESKAGMPSDACRKPPGAEPHEPADLPPVACPLCASLQVAETTACGDDSSWARLKCLDCGHAWMEGENGQQVPLEGPPPGPEEAAFPDRACPACGSLDAEQTPAPDYAVESAVGGFFKRLMGHGWLRCRACGHVWEA